MDDLDRRLPPLALPPVATRTRRTALIATGVAIALVVATIVAVTSWTHRFVAPDARAVGAPVLVGDTIYLPNGSHTTLDLDPAASIDRLTVVPAGYLVDIRRSADDIDDADDTEQELRLIYPNGSYWTVATTFDTDYRVTDDGRTLVIAGSAGPGDNALHAIDIATHQEVRKIDDGYDIFDALGGDWALLSDDEVGQLWRKHELWNVRTGAVLPFAGYIGVLAWDVAADGDVLRGVESAPASVTPGEPTEACYDLAALRGTAPPMAVPTYPTGYCGRFDLADVVLSPDGTWAVFQMRTSTSGSGFEAVRTTDLRGGRWAPTTMAGPGGGGRILFWDSATTFVAPYTDDADHDRYERCSVDGVCRDLGIPGADVVGDVVGDVLGG